MIDASVLNEIVKVKGLSIYQLERDLGFSNGALRKAIQRKSDLKNETINKLIELYPDLNEDFLRKGEGEILRSLIKGDEASPIDLIDEDDVSKNARGTEFRELDNGMLLMTIPLVPEYAYAGYLNGWKDAEFIEELPKHSIVVDKRHSGKYRAFAVRGDSMDNDRKDAISVGDIVTGRNVDKKLWESKLHFHKYPDFVIVHQDGIVIKRIVRHDVENGIIDCTSLNEDKKFYPDFSIKLSEVYELYNIVKQEKQRGI